MPMGEHAGTTLFSRPTFLMCAPRFFDVTYVINPWMEGNLHAPSYALAVQQWKQLRDTVASLADVLEIEPQPALPDMVFTANAGLVGPGPHGSQCVLSRFRHPQRQREEAFFREWFQVEGFTLTEPELDLPFEGEGDALFTPGSTPGTTPAPTHLWAGHGWRTTLASHDLLRKTFCTATNSSACQITSLRLVDPRFYHLDTCFAPLPGGDLLYFPPAFDAPSRDAIERIYPSDQRIAVSEQDALHFACNAVSIGNTLLLNQVTPALEAELTTRGYSVLQIPLTEFLKAGGAAKCLCLRLA